MEQPQYLIDTNVVIDYLGRKLSENGMEFMNTIIDAMPNVSVITKIEILGFNAPPKHLQTLSDFINDAIVLDITDNVVNVCIGIRKKHKIKLPDALIASTALVYELTIITRNTSDFQAIENLKTINPYNIV